MMITCVNSKKESFAHSSIALQYATRAKTITNHAHVNLDADKTSEIEELKSEIEALRRRLDDRQVEFHAVSSEQVFFSPSLFPSPTFPPPLSLSLSPSLPISVYIFIHLFPQM